MALVVWKVSGNDEKPAAPPVAASLVASGSAVPIVVDAAVAEPDAYYDPDDPWSAAPEPVREVPGALATSGDEVPQDVARKEIAAAIRHVPADSHLVFTAAIGELRKHEQIDDVLGKIAKQPLVKAFLASTPPCIQTLVTGAEWAIFATKAIDARTSGTLMIRGRWQRSDVEACFAPDAMPLAMPDGKKMMQLRRVGWVDFVDDHTIYISVRDDLAAAQVHELAQRGNGPSPTTAKLWATIPAARSIGVVIDGSDGLAWPNDSLPKKSDVVAWLRAGEPTEFLVIADTHNAKSAAALVAKVRPTFDEVFKDSQSALIGNVKVVHDKTRMKIEGHMTALLIAMISSQIP